MISGTLLVLALRKSLEGAVSILEAAAVITTWQKFQEGKIVFDVEFTQKMPDGTSRRAVIRDDDPPFDAKVVRAWLRSELPREFLEETSEIATKRGQLFESWKPTLRRLVALQG